MTAPSGARILELIEWLASHGRAATLAETRVALDLPKSSTLVLLRTLVESGYAGRGEDGRYRLLRLPGEASAEGGAWGTIVRITDDVVRDAVSATQESGFIAAMTGERRIRYLSKHLPTREIRYDRDISIDRVAHHVASGIAILSAMTDAEVEGYIASAHRTGSFPAGERATLMTAIAATRRRGGAVNLKGRIEGAGGVAAAILDGTGHPVAALNISGPAERIEAALDSIVAVARDSARLASQALARRLSVPKDDVRTGQRAGRVSSDRSEAASR